MTEQETKRRLLEWIRSRTRKESVGVLTEETAILDEGILSSLDVVELVLFIESLRGDDVDLEAIDPSAFRSVSTLYTTFFAAK